MQNFDVITKVGEGSFASVYKVKRKEDGLIYAMKKIKIANSNSKEMTNTLNQVRILASISNPYILSYKEAVYDETTGCLLLITEFASGGDLTGYIQSHRKRKDYIPESQIWRMSIQMLHGLRTLHKMNIFHRDIKSGNIMLTQNNESIKLGDMNISKISKSGLACTQTGTPYYASPEVWSDLPYNGKCDIWSLGCVLYEMASLRPPFMANDMHALRKKIIAGHYERIPSEYSEDLQSFIRLCLTTAPKERLSAKGLLHSNYIRKRIYSFPKQKFNQSAYDNILNKENKLLQTIRVPNRNSIGEDLKFKLPKSNYESQGMQIVTERNKSLCIPKEQNDGLPELKKRNSSRQVMKEKVNIPKPKLIYLR